MLTEANLVRRHPATHDLMHAYTGFQGCTRGQSEACVCVCQMHEGDLHMYRLTTPAAFGYRGCHHDA